MEIFSLSLSRCNYIPYSKAAMLLALPDLATEYNSEWRFVTLRLLILGGDLLLCGCLFWVEVCYLAVAYSKWRFVT